MVDNDPLIYSQTVTRVPSRAEPWRTDGWTDGRVGAGWRSPSPAASDAWRCVAILGGRRELVANRRALDGHVATDERSEVKREAMSSERWRDGRRTRTCGSESERTSLSYCLMVYCRDEASRMQLLSSLYSSAECAVQNNVRESWTNEVITSYIYSHVIIAINHRLDGCACPHRAPHPL